ncbi:hypothetical protein NC652_024700 [Populus alba x Populus x berolinensis]|nr:hypothetical protein NC652_024700 [Populus alba x Populus x berolinensis]
MILATSAVETPLEYKNSSLGKRVLSGLYKSSSGHFLLNLYTFRTYQQRTGGIGVDGHDNLSLMNY